MKLIKYIKKPELLFYKLTNTFKFRLIPDSLFLKIVYKARVGRRLNLKNPKRFNEKIQWLKLHDRKTAYINMVDKYESKEYVASIIGKEFIVPVLGVWNKFDDIDFSSLPNQFVLKCTHDSGGIIVCKNKELLNIDSAKKKINYFLKKNPYWNHREWPYKNIKPRIIAEKYLENNKKEGLIDYKFYCFDGKPKYCNIGSERFSNSGVKFAFYDMEWNRASIAIEGKGIIENNIEKPKNLEQMICFAEKLSEGFKFLRVDFYNLDGIIYFGELTFYPFSGFRDYIPDEWNVIFGDLLKL